MGIVFGLIYIALLLFFIALIIRLVFEWVQMFARSGGRAALPLVTAHAGLLRHGPAAQRLRRLIPPLRLGGISLDLGFLLLFIAVSIAMAIDQELGVDCSAEPRATDGP